MEAGVDVLIEKPLASTLAEADELQAIARQHDRVVQVGHLERFNPAVRATIPLLTKPMFFEVHRLSVFTPRSLDVDVVLDLMIHDIDIVLTMAQSPVKEIRAVGLPILSKKVDIANVRIEFDSGCVANFTASRVSTERVRKLRFFQPRQYVSLDFSRQDVLVLTVDDEGGCKCGSRSVQSRERGQQRVSRNHAVQAEDRATGASAAELTQLPAGRCASAALRRFRCSRAVTRSLWHCRSSTPSRSTARGHISKN